MLAVMTLVITPPRRRNATASDDPVATVRTTTRTSRLVSGDHLQVDFIGNEAKCSRTAKRCERLQQEDVALIAINI
jgi:hypothetical protein